MERMNLRKRYSPLIAITSLLAVGMLVFTIQTGGILSTAVGKSPANQVQKKNGTVVTKQNNDAKFIKPPMSLFGQQVQTLNDAVSQISVVPKLPNPAVAGNPKEVYVLDAPTPEQKGIGILYENGIQIWIIPNKQPAPNYDATVRIEPNLRLVDVNDAKGIAREPGTQTLMSHGEVPIPGVVAWFENGTEYEIYGDNIGLNVLMPIARSMH
ncbi:MAG: hypothetical protein COW32_09800 [Candidatus Aquicultor secundus]|uniref:Uncharacterized protein n=1 Tax=Candidatus Aquicultor secundus TaxID=1973895 RepID=A0A2M7T8N1_9ACTN|nr:hypothetical protein [Candidatus Aquicultor secundus]OIO85544.1 MAG: hypothetical protein AUK32_06990 [Candidatus Aquicultor secundus]PIU27286.1 MAG: hypothetical protein COT10_04285 [Candidatus Aquicultor secundus]PIW21457.1 MAG: hypothetical protein COW32_09800 [Candidatus Aquicultor secundus]PIX52867.1 MAG: hypothetical protein COZ51_01830 [Candidatus Aquicultor secundus]PIY37944.1 MAG: hypothetical protein COZ03_09130 [Candidatus Aquicultor secundus]